MKGSETPDLERYKCAIEEIEDILDGAPEGSEVEVLDEALTQIHEVVQRFNKKNVCEDQMELNLGLVAAGDLGESPYGGQTYEEAQEAVDDVLNSAPLG